MTKVYCTAPWHGVTIREDGRVRTCCIGETTVDLNTDPVDLIGASDGLQRIKKAMLNGEPDKKNCWRCMEQEKRAGVASLRSYYLKYYPLVDYNQTVPSVIDIRWNNTCNLGCVYCNANSSSTWADRLGAKNSRPVKDYQDDLLKWILDRVDHVKEIQLVGGEPMLIKQNYTLLKHLPKDCKISIITNLSYDLKNLPCLENLLERPASNILWNVSAENVNEKFEYIRSGADWNVFSDNLEFLTQKFPESVTVLMVYNMLSAFDFPETVTKFMDIGVKKFVVNPLFDNPGVDIFLMPPEIQQSAAEKLREALAIHQSRIDPADIELYRMDSGETILKRLESPSPQKILTKSEVDKQIAFYDKWNQHKFSSVWPDLVQMIDRYLDD